jgi:hypothetical protein
MEWRCVPMLHVRRSLLRLNSPTTFVLATVLAAAAVCGRAKGEGVLLRGAPSMRFVSDAGRGAEMLRGMRVSRGDAAVLIFEGSPGLPLRVMVPVDGRAVTLNLAPRSVRAEGFKVRAEVLGASGVREWVDVEPGPVRTYEGTVLEMPGAKVSAFVDGGLVTARLEVPGLPGAYWVEPVPSGQIADERGLTGVVHAGYHSWDVLDRAGVCMTGDAGAPMRQWRGGTEGGERGGCAAAVCVAELACDADFEFFQAYGSVSAAAAQIERVVGVMNQQYISEVGIRHRITTILVRTVSGAPYASFNGGGLLVQMRDEWNANQTAVQRDLAQLFTAKALSGSVQGVAISGTVCDTSQAYSIVRSNCCGSLAGATDLSAHELGHIWGATHCACSFPNPDSTMNATLTGRNSFVTDISGASVASILAGRAGAGCLSEETPAAAPGAFSLVSPGDGAFGVGLPIVLTWGPASGVQFYSLTLSLNADLSDPLVSYATHDLTFTVPGLLNAQATRYYWKVEAWNGDSVKTVGTPGVGVFTTFVPPAACPGDFTGDNMVNTVDLSILLGGFGKLVPPGRNGDMNGDGRVNTADLTAFLGRFGQSCQ